MSENVLLDNFDILKFRDRETEKYSVWVYFNGSIPSVYEEEQPNTVEVWFRFYKINHFYWKMLESECVDNIKNGSFYNFNKLKLFMIRRMLCSTNIDGVLVEYGKNGFLTERSFDSVMRIHPRILRVMMDKIDVLPKQMNKSEERELEKQCSLLFGKGEGVMNPHEYITIYCNLVSFWDKFGMNYFDILRLPQEVFSALKKVLSLENSNKSARMEEMSRPSPQSKSQRNRKSVRF